MTEVPRGWVEGLQVALQAAGWPGGPEAAGEAAAAFAARLPGSYFERTAPGAAAGDLVQCQALVPTDNQGPPVLGAVRMAVQSDPDPGAGMFRLRRYGGTGLELSSFLPVLESFGLSVVEAVPHQIEWPPGRVPLHLDDFGLRARGRWRFDPAADGERLVDAVQAACRNDAEVDSLNRLVGAARFGWRDVVVLRAYRRYRRQAGTAWTDRQLDDPLVAFPVVTVALLDYFRARFDPTAACPQSEVEVARQAVLDSLTEVERLEDDQVLRAYLALIDATVRTSHYARTSGGERLPTLTLKLDSARAPELPPPRPCVEAFVYSPRVEGLHLRGGLVARGGIRWSDRQDDLRTEVLDLVRAQVLKNSGIVPTGAKGGFVCKRLDPAVQAGRLDGDVSGFDAVAEVADCYRLFVSSLLDIEDNVVAGHVVTPAGVRAADPDDTYLVVAADRGTAHFSDLANEISIDHGFWLGDAFASGGSHGYDHKAMGITARGAWVATQQHFRQLGIDVQREEIRVVGIGDMSGDVFGNGMLQSRTIKLIAAFDHRDIFIDPFPDPARSFAARAQLFARPRSSWHDYDRDALSPGGGVWSRRSKRIVLAPEAQAALGISSAVVSPPELVSAILAASADLLWFGGIGTFVKGSGQSNADVGDQANNTIRINADQVRARVVTEGGNLGFTQRARVAYSRRGGKINTDFIDNAAGVATSDYEVNLKILLALAMEHGRLASGERDALLAGLESDVADAVLRDIGRSVREVTRAVPASAADLDSFEALMTGLEAVGRLDRKVEALPDGEELAVRRAVGAGLTRPEAAVLFALAKSDLAHALEDLGPSTGLAGRQIAAAVDAYFPSRVAERFADLVGQHRLYPQLVATRIGSEIIDQMGITWAHETADEFGAGLADVAAAYWAARQVLDADRWWREIEALAPGISADAETALHVVVAVAVEKLARRYLESVPIDVERRVAEDRPVAAEIEARPGRGSNEAAHLVDAGVEPGVAESFARLPSVAAAGDVGPLSRATAASVNDVVIALDAFDEAIELPAFVAQVAAAAAISRWDRWQSRRLIDDVAGLRRDAVAAAFSRSSERDPAGAMLAWLDGRGARRQRWQGLVRQLGQSGADARSVAALAVRALSDLVTSR